MIRELFRKLFVENAALKAVSLILAVTLFIVVRGEKDVQLGAAMKVVYTTPDDRVLVSEPVHEIRMIVRGPWSRIKRFDERDLEPIHIDLREHKNGIFRFEAGLVSGMPPGLEIVSFAPPSLELRFEELGTAVVPVTVPVEGEPAYGFEVQRLDPEPPTVVVKGPKSDVLSLKGVMTRPVSVAGATGSVTVEVPLAALPRNFEATQPRPIRVRVQIGSRQDAITREKVPVEISGLSQASGTLDPVDVTLVLRGPRLALDAVKFDQVRALVEATREDDEKDGQRPKRVNVTGLPSGVAFEAKPPEVLLRTKRKSP